MLDGWLAPFQRLAGVLTFDWQGLRRLRYGLRVSFRMEKLSTIGKEGISRWTIESRGAGAALAIVRWTVVSVCSLGQDIPVALVLVSQPGFAERSWVGIVPEGVGGVPAAGPFVTVRPTIALECQRGQRLAY